MSADFHLLLRGSSIDPEVLGTALLCRALSGVLEQQSATVISISISSPSSSLEGLNAIGISLIA